MVRNKKNEKGQLYGLLVDYTFMFLLVISCNSMYTVLNKTFSTTSLSLVITVIFLPISIQNIILHHNLNFSKLVTFFCYYFFWIALVLGTVKIVNNLRFFTIFVLLFPTCVLYFYARYLDGQVLLVLRRLVNTIVFFSIFSLVLWVLFSNLDLVKGTSMYSSWSGLTVTRFWWVHFNTQTESFFGLSLIRNTGIFPEAPMFAYLLLIGVFVELFVNNRTNICIMFVLMITLITTLSTTGLLFGVLAIFLKVGLKYINRINLNSWTIIVGLLIVAFFVVKLLLQQKSGSSSARVRDDDIHAGLQAWKQNIIFGNGFSNSNVIRNHMASWRQHVGNMSSLGYTSGILTILSDGGIMLFSLYIAPLLVLFKRKSAMFLNRKLLVALIFMLATLVVTITPYVPLTIFMLSFFYVYYFIMGCNREV